jgi:hypothetical protein
VGTRDQDVKSIVEGLALGVLAQEVEALTANKMALTLNFNHAWRRWSRAGQFPTLAASSAGDRMLGGIYKSERRKMTCAAWMVGRWVEPYVLYENWTVNECLDHISDERASAEDWVELADLYVARFKADEIRRLLPESNEDDI